MIPLVKTDPATWDEIELRLREMGWTDDHLKNFAKTIGGMAIACGAESISPHSMAFLDHDEEGAA